MSVKIKVEINSDVVKDMRRFLKKHHNYVYRSTDYDLATAFIESIETMPSKELVEVLLGCCSPEELLG